MSLRISQFISLIKILACTCVFTSFHSSSQSSLPLTDQKSKALSSIERPETSSDYVLADANEEFDYCQQQAWLDQSFCYLEYGIAESAYAINDWFVDEEGKQTGVPTARGRIRFGWEPRSGNLNEFDFRFRIRARLPALENRVELLLSDDENDVNRQEVKAAQSRELGNRNQTVVALQFKNKEDDKISYRVGFGRGSQIYTRARYTDSEKLSENASFNYFAEANYYSGDKLGFELNGAFGTQITSRSAVEFTNSFNFRDKSSDWFWRHEIQYLVLGDNDQSYLFTAMIDGLSRPTYRKEQMLVSFRYKRRVLREWLFIEVEPFVLWLREEDFRSSMGLALRAEVHFDT